MPCGQKELSPREVTHLYKQKGCYIYQLPCHCQNSQPLQKHFLQLTNQLTSFRTPTSGSHFVFYLTKSENYIVFSLPVIHIKLITTKNCTWLPWFWELAFLTKTGISPRLFQVFKTNDKALLLRSENSLKEQNSFTVNWGYFHVSRVNFIKGKIFCNIFIVISLWIRWNGSDEFYPYHERNPSQPYFWGIL